MSNQICSLAAEILDRRESALVSHLTELLGDSRRGAASLIEDIIPIYSDESGQHTLEPDPIYRPFMYLRNYPDSPNFAKNTRIFILNACWHIEGCLVWLMASPPRFRGPKGPFGKLLNTLREKGIIPLHLADHLTKFNRVIYVPAHHPSRMYVPKSLTTESTFSIQDAAATFVVTRNLSTQLFEILKANGVRLPNDWKQFKDEWLHQAHSGSHSASTHGKG